MPFARISLIATLFLVALADDCAHAAYTFTNIASSATAPLIRSFEINGGVAAIQTATEIFTVAGNTRTKIVAAGDPAPAGVFVAQPFGTGSAIGLSGTTVSFPAGYTSGFGVFTGAGGPLSTIATIGAASPEGPLAAFSTNNGVVLSSSSVAFGASYGLNQHALLRSTGGTLTTIVKIGDPGPVGDFSILGDPAISGDRVAFTAQTTNNGAGIFTGAGGAITTIVKRGDPAPTSTFSEFFTFDRPAIVGDSVAFRGAFGGSNIGIFTGNGGPLTTIAKSGDAAPNGVFLDLGRGPDTDIGYDGSQVAFLGTYTGGRGVFVGNGGPISTVIKSGDQLFGQIITGFWHTRVALDPTGTGKVLFAYRLNNGLTGVAMATPVPEPAALALTATMIALLIRRRPAP